MSEPEERSLREDLVRYDDADGNQVVPVTRDDPPPHSGPPSDRARAAAWLTYCRMRRRDIAHEGDLGKFLALESSPWHAGWDAAGTPDPEPGTSDAIMTALFDEANRLGRNPVSSVHALTYLINEVERLRLLDDRRRSLELSLRELVEAQDALERETDQGTLATYADADDRFAAALAQARALLAEEETDAAAPNSLP
jgi:hypothetical protein